MPVGMTIDRGLGLCGPKQLSELWRVRTSLQSRGSGRGDYAWVVRKGWVIRPLASRFDSDFVIHGDSKLLLTTEVMLGRLDGYVPEQELYLVELTAG